MVKGKAGIVSGGTAAEHGRSLALRPCSRQSRGGFAPDDGRRGKRLAKTLRPLSYATRPIVGAA